MNKDYETLKSILDQLRSDYISGCDLDEINPFATITERDIVAEIYCRLKEFCNSEGLYVHCEIKPACSEEAEPDELRRLPKIDVGILSDVDGRSWIASAIKLQKKYENGNIEARFSSIPVEFFHTAIEVKKISKVDRAKRDIDKLRELKDSNLDCHCFLVLLNAWGRRSDHDAIQKYADEKRICMLEYSCK